MKKLLILILSSFSLFCSAQSSYGYEVCDFNQGPTNNNTSVINERSNSIKSLDKPQNFDIENGNINFVSLGFGGSITLKLQSAYPVTSNTTFKICETTYNYTNCSTYGEKAEVYLSKDNINYFFLGETCLNSNTVLSPYGIGLDSILYVKVVDISDINSFSNYSFICDGYDLDGIEIFENGPLPIVLSYFGVEYKQQNLSVKFITESETNTDVFIVQSSEDLKDFQNLTFFNAAGYSSFERLYDRKLIFEPKSSVTYFRLVEVDYNGDVYYFDIIPVNTKDSQVDVYFFDLLGRRITDDSIFKIKSGY
jgi:hypothetical protein